MVSKEVLLVMGNVVILVFAVLSITTGGILTGIAIDTPGRYHRTAGICTAVESVKVLSFGGSYRPLWGVTVFAGDDVDMTNPLFWNASSVNDDIRSPGVYALSHDLALSELDTHPVGSSTPCIYPSNPAPYPSGNNLKSRGVILRNYTDSQLRSVYETFNAMINAGISLLVVGGVLFFVQTRYLVVKYCIELLCS